MIKKYKNYQVVGPFKKRLPENNHANILICKDDKDKNGFAADVVLKSKKIGISHPIVHVSISTTNMQPCRYIEENHIDKKEYDLYDKYVEDNDGEYYFYKDIKNIDGEKQFGYCHVSEKNIHNCNMDKKYKKITKKIKKNISCLSDGQFLERQWIENNNLNNKNLYYPSNQDRIYSNTSNLFPTWNKNIPNAAAVSYYYPRHYLKDNKIENSAEADICIKGVCSDYFDSSSWDNGLINKTFSLSETGILEFDLIKGYNWEIYFLKDMPENTIIDIVWEYGDR